MSYGRGATGGRKWAIAPFTYKEHRTASVHLRASPQAGVLGFVYTRPDSYRKRATDLFAYKKDHGPFSATYALRRVLRAAKADETGATRLFAYNKDHGAASDTIRAPPLPPAIQSSHQGTGAFAWQPSRSAKAEKRSECAVCL